ncbi:MAG TPA: thioesterase family protein [Syntrophales bacterium]|nr:thioesterase family protein [Syntrophales bacterium]
MNNMNSPLLDAFPVVITIPVAWGEMDAFQHVNNGAYFRYFESARMAYYDRLNLRDLRSRTGIGPILAETSCKFKTPLTYPDTVLVGVKVTRMLDDRFMMNHRIVSKKLQKIAAEGNSVIATFNYKENKKARVPEELKLQILNLEKSVSSI